MTRNEFNAKFAATSDNTEGYSDTQLQHLNDLVFENVQDLDTADDITQSHVQNMFARHCADFSVAES